MKLFKRCIFLLVIPFTATFPGCGPEGTGSDEGYYVLSWDQNWLVEKHSDYLLVKASYIDENIAGNPEVEAGVIVLDGDGVQGEFFPANRYSPASVGVVFETKLDYLEPETEYSLRTYVKAGGKTYYGTTTRTAATDKADPDGPDVGVFFTQPAVSDVTYNSAKLSVSWTYPGIGTVTGAEFRYRKAVSSVWQPLTARMEGALMVADLTGLEEGTEYKFKVLAKIDGEAANESAVAAFTTLSRNTDPDYTISVSTPATGNLAYNSVRLSGSWSFTSGTATVDEVGFRYSKDGTTGWNTLTSSGTSNPCYYTWTAANGGLEASTKYYVTFWVKIGEAVHESRTADFTTPQSPYLPPPTGQALWAELPVMKQTEGVYYVTHFVNSAGQAIAKPTDAGRVRSYTVAFDSKDYKTLWTAAPMHAWYGGGAGRTDAWNYDPYIPQNVQPNLKSSYDAVGDGAFSRGHLVASSDRLRSSAMNTQTFYYTNMAPQHQTRFNDGIWNQLEQKVQGWGNAAADTVYVVTGLIYEGSKQTSDNSGKRLPVPSHFYKAIISSKSGRTGKSIAQMSASELRCVGFLFENRAYTEGLSSKFMVKVSDIESRAGYEFFPMLSESAKSVKNSYTASDWGM